MYFVLPATLGFYVEGASLCNNATCPPGLCSCAPGLNGRVYATMARTMGGDSYPPRCGKGVYANSTDISNQMSPLCGGTCTEGHYCTQGSRKPIPCRAGTYNRAKGASSQDDCTDCTVGSYCEAGSPQPTPCRSGKLANETSLQNASCAGDCPVGFFCASGSSLPCAPGTYGARPGLKRQDECSRCKDGYWCSGGHAHPCMNGTYMALERTADNTSTQGSCTTCPVHTTTLAEGMPSDPYPCVCESLFVRNLTTQNESASGSDPCILCPTGFNCDETGADTVNAPIRSGFWRPGRTFPKAKRCPIDGTLHACTLSGVRCVGLVGRGRQRAGAGGIFAASGHWRATRRRRRVRALPDLRLLLRACAAVRPGAVGPLSRHGVDTEQTLSWHCGTEARRLAALRP